jgi:hypothetical protein
MPPRCEPGRLAPRAKAPSITSGSSLAASSGSAWPLTLERERPGPLLALPDRGAPRVITRQRERRSGGLVDRTFYPSDVIVSGRLPAAGEATACFVVAEALTTSPSTPAQSAPR